MNFGGLICLITFCREVFSKLECWGYCFIENFFFKVRNLHFEGWVLVWGWWGWCSYPRIHFHLRIHFYLLLCCLCFKAGQVSLMNFFFFCRSAIGSQVIPLCKFAGSILGNPWHCQLNKLMWLVPQASALSFLCSVFAELNPGEMLRTGETALKTKGCT